MIILDVKITGLDDLSDKLKQMENAANELNGTHQVPFSELFTPDFMRKHTKFNTFDEMLTAGGFEVNSIEDFKAIPDDAFDEHIAKNTSFNNWNDMQSKAVSEYALKMLGI